MIRDSKDRSLSLGNGVLRSSYGDVGDRRIIGSLVDVDLSTSGVLNLVDSSASLSENTSNRTSGDSELGDVVRLLLEFGGVEQLSLSLSDTLLSTLDKDFIGLEGLAGLTLTTLGGFTRESNLDSIFLLEPDGVFAVLPDKRRVILGGNLQDFGSFIGLDMTIH